MGYTIITGNTYIIINIILESRGLVISSLHIGLNNGDAKYRIYSSKTENVTNITIHNITESIESNKMLEVTDDEGEIQLLIGLKCTLIVTDTGSPILTTPHYMILVFCKTNVRYYQYNTEADTDHYLQQYSAASCISICFIQQFLWF